LNTPENSDNLSSNEVLIMSSERSTPVRVLIADDHFTVRAGLRWIVSQDTSLLCVGEVEDGASLAPAITETQPDILVLDLSMPRFPDPAGFVRETKKSHPNLQILVLTGYDDEELVYGLLSAGASGYVLKEDAKADLTEALHRVSQGRGHYSQRVAELIARNLVQSASPEQKKPEEQEERANGELTSREVEILQGVGSGLSNTDIAETLNISVYTVRSHISRINTKLGLSSSRREMMRYAFDHGFTKTNSNGRRTVGL
jgi:two-component system, NarL family, response regulator LiaR